MTEITTYLSPNGQTQTRGAGPAMRILVGTVEGVATLGRKGVGAPWRLVGRSLEHRHVGQLVYEAGSGKLFAGAHADGGLWVSDDGEGADWRQLTIGLDRPHCYAMAARRLGDRVSLFLGTSPAALYRSEDLGESWVEVTSIHDVPDTDKWTFPPPPHIAHVKQILSHPTEPDTLFVLVEQGALLKSIDDGATWRELTGYCRDDVDEAYRDPHRMLIKEDEPDIFYLATGIGLYRSGDGGETFEKLTGRGERMGYPDLVFLDPDDGHTVFLGGSFLNPRDWYKTGIARSCILRSTDEGRTWLELNHGMPDPVVGAFQAMTQHLWDGGMMLVIGSATGEVYASEDRGASWQLISTEVKPVAKGEHHVPFLSEQIREETRLRRGI